MAGRAWTFGNGHAARIYDRQGRLSHYLLTYLYAPRDLKIAKNLPHDLQKTLVKET